MRSRCFAALTFLIVACSFVRDPDRYSEGTEALDAGAGGAGGAGGSSCKAGGESCQLSSECCLGICVQDECASCKAVTESCTGPSDCCSGNCDNDTCATCLAPSFECDPQNPRCCPDLVCEPVGGAVYKCVARDACIAEDPPADAESLMKACDESCKNATRDPAQTQCYTGCVANSGSTTNCASCYAGWWLCVTDLCPTDPCCTTCMDSFFTACSGLSTCPAI